MTSGISVSHSLNQHATSTQTPVKSAYNTVGFHVTFPVSLSWFNLPIDLSFPISTLITTIYFDHIYLPIAPPSSSLLSVLTA